MVNESTPLLPANTPLAAPQSETDDNHTFLTRAIFRIINISHAMPTPSTANERRLLERQLLELGQQRQSLEAERDRLEGSYMCCGKRWTVRDMPKVTFGACSFVLLIVCATTVRDIYYPPAQ